MSTSINVRLSDEQENNLKNIILDVKRKTPSGAEVNGSTIVRGALEELNKKIEDEKREVVKVSISLANTEKKELEESLKLLQTMINSIDKDSLKYENSKNVLAVIELLKIKVKGKLIDIIY